jgi:hypothetical protein
VLPQQKRQRRRLAQGLGLLKLLLMPEGRKVPPKTASKAKDSGDGVRLTKYVTFEHGDGKHDSVKQGISRSLLLYASS